MSEQISMDEIIKVLGGMQLQLMVANKENEELRQRIKQLEGGDKNATDGGGEGTGNNT